MAELVITHATGDTGPQGSLFKGTKFWFSQKVPQRARFINDVKANGGEVLPIEKHADVKIVDHARKEILPGTHSYTFIETSLRNGILEDLQDHKAGPPEGTVRTIGSIVQPAKGTRNKFTEADDRILWDWVQKNPQKGGGTDGNEIYKQLEAKYPQHPWQSWRDHFIKNLKGKPRLFSRPHNAPPTPPSDALVTTEPPKETQASSNNELNHDELNDEFDEEEAEMLMKWGEDILDVVPERLDDAWKAWANGVNEEYSHSASQWRSFWEERVLPRYLKRKAKEATRSAAEQLAWSGSATPTPAAKPTNSSQSAFSPFSQKSSNTIPIPSSPSYHSESPNLQLTSESTAGQVNNKSHSSAGTNSPVAQVLADKSTLLGMSRPAEGENIKRKHGSFEDEIPSSSPLGPAPPPKRKRSNGLDMPREIASTPESSPAAAAKQRSSPIYIEIDDNSEEEASDSEENEEEEEENYGPLGQEPSDTLSEPDPAVHDTQAMLKASTQAIDFDVPPPDEGWDEPATQHQHHAHLTDVNVPPPEAGWDDEDSGDEASESDSSSTSTITEIYDPRPEVPETQGILQKQTQTPHFAVPDPDDDGNNLIPSSPPPMPDFPRGQSQDPDIEAQTDAWIDAHVAEGFSEEQVELALQCTSMDTNLAEEVLKHLARKGGIPRNERGVWTEADDRRLRSTDAREIQRLEEKHGSDSFTARWEFLDFMSGVSLPQQ